MAARGARYTPLKRGPSGGMASKRSKTGDPACSEAMSIWQRARHSGAAVAAGVFQVLAGCRAKARAMNGGAPVGQAGAMPGQSPRAMATGRQAGPHFRVNREANLARRVESRLAQRIERTRKEALSANPRAPRAAAVPTAPAGRSPEEVHARVSAWRDRARGNGRELIQRMRGAVKERLKAMPPGPARTVPTPAPAPSKHAAHLRIGGKGVMGPAAAIASARARQERSFGASLFGGKRLAPDAGPVRPIARSMGSPVLKPSAPAPAPAPARPAQAPPDNAAARLARLRRQHATLSRTGPELEGKIGSTRKEIDRLSSDVIAAREGRLKSEDPAFIHKTRKEVHRLRKELSRLEGKAPQHKARLDRISAEIGRLEPNAKAATPKAAPKPKARPEPARDDGQGRLGLGGEHVAPRIEPKPPPAPVAPPPPQPKPRPSLAERHGREMLSARQRTADRVRSLQEHHREHASPETHGKADVPYMVKTEHIHFDPGRFQYKLEARGQHGVTDALSDVKSWNPKLAGVISVWRDPANGKTYVVNGHHRLDLAKRLGVEHVKAQYLDSPDAIEARGHGAMINIAEGRGTAVDAAKYFRDTGVTPEKARAEGVSLREHTARQGLALANLHPHIFSKVVNGKVSIDRGAIIGGSGLSHVHQAALDKMLRQPKFKNATNGAIKNLIDIHKASQTKAVKVRDLFGEDVQEQSLALHRATLEDTIQRRLAADSRLFGLVSKSKAAESLKERGNSEIDLAATGKESEESRGILALFNQHKHLAGPLNRSLNEGSERLHAGENRKKVESEHYKHAVEHLKRILENPGETFNQ